MPTKMGRREAPLGIRRLGILLALLLAACAPAAPATTPQSAPAAGAPPQSVPAGTASGADWEQQWNALIAAAKQEGTLVVLGPPTPELRLRLPEAFQQRFGITIEYTGQASGEYGPRLVSERTAGIYTADIVIAGSGSMYEILAGGGKIE